MNFDYKHKTRENYKDDRSAEVYHNAFAASNGLKTIPFRYVATRERRVVKSLLHRIPHGTIIDIPAGSGKLASTFAELGSRAFACDISANMLAIAKSEYQRIRYNAVQFMVNDIVQLSEFAPPSLDAVVCLRLMHRVPRDVRQVMLKEISLVAPYAIVSFGIDNRFHELRHALRKAVFGGKRDDLCYCSMSSARSEVSSMFVIRKQKWIAPALSRELIFLLESKEHTSAKSAIEIRN
ncbi:MAG: class I SAM-dependent methyltransferase [Rhodanobacteraceae bacterium]